MIIDLGAVAAWMGTITAIGTPLTVLAVKISRFLKRLDNLEEWTKHQQEDIEDSKQEREILLRGTLACLKGLREQGCNGPVQKGIEDIEAFLYEEAHRGNSHK